MEKLLPVAGLLLLGLAQPAMAADASAGEAKYNAVCTTCHGADGAGNQAMNSPAIAGLQAWYVARQLKHFKEGVRGADAKDAYGAMMRPMAMTLADDAEIDNVSAYVASLAPVKAEITMDGDAEKGKSNYTLCTSCHAVDGKGNDAMNAPMLTGLQDWYIARQLQGFKDGLRGTATGDVYGMQMRPMSMALTDEQAIKDVTAYIMTLR